MSYDIARWHSLKPVIDARLRAGTMTVEQVEAFSRMSPEALRIVFSPTASHSHKDAVQIGNAHVLMSPVPPK